MYAMHDEIGCCLHGSNVECDGTPKWARDAQEKSERQKESIKRLTNVVVKRNARMIEMNAQIQAMWEILLEDGKSFKEVKAMIAKKMQG